MSNTVHRHQQREQLIKKKEFESQQDVHVDKCLHLNAHIHAMLDKEGDHLQDIPLYIQSMKDNKCEVSKHLQNRLKNSGIQIGGRRASKKHSKKHRKSKRSKKTKSRRH